MVMLSQLKPGSFARIVKIDNSLFIRDKLNSKGIFEGCFIMVISCFGLITFNANSKIFSISKVLAKNVRVIKLIYQHHTFFEEIIFG